jgi:hypothetical protein
VQNGIGRSEAAGMVGAMASGAGETRAGGESKINRKKSQKKGREDKRPRGRLAGCRLVGQKHANRKGVRPQLSIFLTRPDTEVYVFRAGGIGQGGKTRQMRELSNELSLKK